MSFAKFKHNLRHNKTTAIPQEFIFFDTETIPTVVGSDVIEQRFRLGVALYWRRRTDRHPDIEEWFYFSSPQDFWLWVDSKTAPHRKICLMAHNLSFDMQATSGFEHLYFLGFKATKLILDYRRQIWQYRRETSSLLFLDTMNYFSVSLAQLGESLGFPKDTMPAFEESDEVWSAYCRRDVEVCREAMKRWIDFLIVNDLGSFGKTLASQAFNAFRHRFMPHPITVHASSWATALERESYRGGRVEVFRLGDLSGQKWTLLDINSMYPYVMANCDYPTRLISTGKTISASRLARLINDHCATAHVIVNTDEPVYGVRFKGRLCFPVGRFAVALNTTELNYALQHNHLERVLSYCFYERAPIFEDYVDFFYKARLDFKYQGNEAFSFMAKLLLNSLYGKFGQKLEEWEYVGTDETIQYAAWSEYDVDDQINYKYRTINYVTERSKGHIEGFNSFVAISAEVTSNARMLLWEIITKAGRANVVYTDTDSVITNDTGLGRLKAYLSQTDLGSLKVEATTKKLIINNAKDYHFDATWKCKGISKGAMIDAKGDYWQWKGDGIKTGLHKGDPNRVLWHFKPKHLAGDYLKGIVCSDGSVRPFRLAFDSTTSSNTLDVGAHR